MNITQVAIYKSPISLTEPFITSFGPETHAENIVVTLFTDEGFRGWGECSPFLPINGESMETAFSVGQYLAKLLLGKNPLAIEEFHKAADKLIYANNSIKSAFDIALYDIAAQKANLPLYAFIEGKKNKPLVIDYTISLDEPAKMAEDAKKIVANGFTIIKVKLGQTKEQDVERIRRIREAVGYQIPLRIDANQGWTVETAIGTLKALAPYNIQYCEEPIAKHFYTELPHVRRESPVAIMADESCFDHHDAKRLIDINACDYFNIKLGKSAGIFKALKIVSLAESAGKKMQVGGFLESRLGFTAAAHFATVSNSILFYDWDTPLMFSEDPVAGGVTYGEGGVITLTETPGLGAALDETYLNGLEKVVIG